MQAFIKDNKYRYLNFFYLLIHMLTSIHVIGISGAVCFCVEIYTFFQNSWRVGIENYVVLEPFEVSEK